MDILEKIKQAGLVGRGGACFPVWQKWSAVKNAKGAKKFIVCNAAEGEPGVLKDGYILERYPEKVIDGMRLAMDFLSADPKALSGEEAVKGYLFLNYAYYKKLNKKISAAIKNFPIEVFIKPINAGYIGGEESAVLNAIEGRRVEPRLKPPFPTEQGLWGCPTLVNNVETLYNVSLVNSGQYNNYRFYSLGGDCLNEGVYYLPESFTIEKILKETKNYPKFPFFVQIGGQASGEVLNSRQLRRPAEGAGSIAVYSLARHDHKKLIKGWLDFFIKETCGQCAPCREGTLRLKEVFLKEKIDWPLFNDLLDNLRDSSFCALGASAPVAITSFIRNVYPQVSQSKASGHIYNNYG